MSDLVPAAASKDGMSIGDWIALVLYVMLVLAHCGASRDPSLRTAEGMGAMTGTAIMPVVIMLVVRLVYRLATGRRMARFRRKTLWTGVVLLAAAFPAAQERGKAREAQVRSLWERSAAFHESFDRRIEELKLPQAMELAELTSARGIQTARRTIADFLKTLDAYEQGLRDLKPALERDIQALDVSADEREGIRAGFDRGAEAGMAEFSQLMALRRAVAAQCTAVVDFMEARAGHIHVDKEGKVIMELPGDAQQGNALLEELDRALDRERAKLEGMHRRAREQYEQRGLPPQPAG
ncbi:MAG TPA: hypothetical protein DCM87_06610 [Planctomycetes bacterium]|nr:hypothetical protein [Planctomycetota bacterium]